MVHCLLWLFNILGFFGGSCMEGSVFSLWLLFYYCKSLNERCILKKQWMNDGRQKMNICTRIALNSILTLICAHMQSITVIWAENFNEASGSLAPISYFIWMGLAPLNLKPFWKSAMISQSLQSVLILSVCLITPGIILCSTEMQVLPYVVGKTSSIIHRPEMPFLQNLGTATTLLVPLENLTEDLGGFLLMQKPAAIFCELIHRFSCQLCVFLPYDLGSGTRHL